VAEKDKGMKFCMRVLLLSGQVFSHFGRLQLAGSHSVHYFQDVRTGAMRRLPATLGGQSELGAVARCGSWNWGWEHRVRLYGGICILLTHLFEFFVKMVLDF